MRLELEEVQLRHCSFKWLDPGQRAITTQNGKLLWQREKGLWHSMQLLLKLILKVLHTPSVHSLPSKVNPVANHARDAVLN